MLDFLDVFGATGAGAKRASGIAGAIGRMLGTGFLALFFMLTIYTLW